MKNQSCSEQNQCEGGALERPRYFDRQLITSEDLNQEQRYFREKLRRHNRLLHGWGVVCGALVCPAVDTNGDNKTWVVSVKPGYALGPYGDEILIDRECEFELRSSGLAGMNGDPLSTAPDPWCSPVTETRLQSPVYIAVKYREFACRPVKVQPIGCGCDDTHCEYSRWRDGFEIGVIDECPQSHQQPPEDIGDIFSGPIPECAPCPNSPWVVLAKVEFDPETGEILSIDNCSCRRMVVSLQHAWWRCEESGEKPYPGQKLEVMSVRALGVFSRGAEKVETEIKGRGFLEGATVNFGNHIEVLEAKVEDSTRIRAMVNIAMNAANGPRDVTVTNPDGQVATLTGAITVGLGRTKEPSPKEPKPKQPQRKKAVPKKKARSRKSTK